MHFRGCSGPPNRLPKSYCAGETEDIEHAVSHVRRQLDGEALFVVGFSLGGNALLNWLATRGERAGVDGAAAVSVPFLLREAAVRMGSGASRLYQWYFLNRLKSTYRRKFRNRNDAPFPLASLGSVESFFDFDDAVTAPLHGYTSAEDYYARASCRQRLAEIVVPTLIVHAIDDPFMTPCAIPTPDELSPAITLELTEHGGHVGFVGGSLLKPRYLLDERIPGFLREIADRRHARIRDEPWRSARGQASSPASANHVPVR